MKSLDLLVGSSIQGASRTTPRLARLFAERKADRSRGARQAWSHSHCGSNALLVIRSGAWLDHPVKSANLSYLLGLRILKPIKNSRFHFTAESGEETCHWEVWPSVSAECFGWFEVNTNAVFVCLGSVWYLRLPQLPCHARSLLPRIASVNPQLLAVHLPVPSPESTIVRDRPLRGSCASSPSLLAKAASPSK
jgi:hypothetical protein